MADTRRTIEYLRSLSPRQRLNLAKEDRERMLKAAIKRHGFTCEEVPAQHRHLWDEIHRGA